MYKHLTQEERNSIADYLNQGKKQCEIAILIGRIKSTISREIKRNSNENGQYIAPEAQRKYRQNRRKCRKKYRFEKNKKLLNYVKSSFSKFWSPETIATVWSRRSHQKPIAFSTIYNWLNNGILTGLSRREHLRRRGKKRFKKGSSATIKPTKTIHERPIIVNQRERIGDFEGDTVLGGIGKGCIFTAVDRKSRFLIAGVSKDKTSKNLQKIIEKSMKNATKHTLTLDLGSEFAKFEEFSKSLKIDTYFCEPHSPWQRGLNENTNGILRFFFPKGSDFRKLSDKKLQIIVNLINSRPRKCLDWKTPHEVFYEKKLHLA